jgi:PPOX class probable F420-dependent enzyme
MLSKEMGYMNLSDSLIHQLLDKMPVARFAVTRSDGRAEAMPIVFSRVGNQIFSPIDGKPKKTADLERLRHVGKTPESTLLLDSYQKDWSKLWWLRLEVRAVVCTSSHSKWCEAVDRLREKYPQYRSIPLFKGTPTMIVMDWNRAYSWAFNGIDGIQSWLSDTAEQ